MIHRVFSSLKSFKELKLGPGLNILLSDKSDGATDLQTRNRSGKSSLVELIHFICGGNYDADSTFRASELVQSSFGLELDVFGQAVSVSRSGSEPSKIVIERGETTLWPKQPKTEKDSARKFISNNAWKTVLGRAFFDIDEDADSEEPDENAGRPTFRSLFSYFARRESSGGMRDTTRNSSMQQKGNEQIAVSYLIGIDWTIAQQWEAVRQKEKQIRELKRIVGQGLLTEVLDSAASLRSRLVVAEQKLKRVVTTLSSFRVLEQYHSLEREASVITRELADLSDENELDRTYIGDLEAAMQTEAPPMPTDLTHLYEEAGVVLPDLVRRRYEDVLKFHESVVRNRRSYLQAELAAASERLRSRDIKREQLDRRRSELMGMLKSHGALDQFVALQSEHGRLQAETETLRRRFEAASQLESTSSSLESDRVRLVERLRQEFSERSAVLDDAIRAFSNIVEELYGEPGQLEFHPTHNGPELRIAIQGDRSRGIGNMEIFCFDMMLQRMCARQEIGPGFLVHDSHLFDGVDPRQTGRALVVGARLAEEVGFQYLVTLNSDVLSELPADFKVEQYLVPQRLTDATEDGGLFGIRFEPPRGNQSEDGTRRRKASSKLKATA
ncbi:MAG TPA: ABC-three component system protein [Thermoanaerobaculia bacterium]|jgi:uncharacterized protein YydD (DUF2326 family)